MSQQLEAVACLPHHARCSPVNMSEQGGLIPSRGQHHIAAILGGFEHMFHVIQRVEGVAYIRCLQGRTVGTEYDNTPVLFQLMSDGGQHALPEIGAELAP